MTIGGKAAAAFTVLLLFAINNDDFEVEAKPKEVIPVPGWFNSVEGFVVPNLNKYRSTEIDKLSAKHIIQLASDELERIRKKNRKQRLQLVKHISKQLQDEEVKKFDKTKKKKKKKKKKDKKRKLVFIRSQAENKDNKSVITISQEDTKKNPVDIIVHIKMNE